MSALDREIAAAVERSARALAAAGVPAERADVMQEGFVLALQALETYDPGRGPVGAYLRPVLRACLGKAVARWLSPWSLSDQAARDAEQLEAADLDLVVDDAPTPEQLVAEAEARARVAVAVGRALAEMPARAAQIAANDLGEPSPVVAARLGIDAGWVREARGDLVRRVRAVVG